MTVQWTKPGCDGGYTDHYILEYCQVTEDGTCLHGKCKNRIVVIPAGASDDGWAIHSIHLSINFFSSPVGSLCHTHGIV